jgi:hypothetical protein
MLDFPPGYATSVFMSLENRTPSALLKAGFSTSTAIDVRLGQPENAPLPIKVTLAGSVTLVNGVI